MRLVLDLETTSTADLRKTGSHAYAEHPDTRVTVLCFAIDAGPVETWLNGPPPKLFVDAVRAGATVVAHNFQFEFNIYFNKLVPQGWPVIPLSQWSCTMARALVAGYPASLDLVGRALGLTQQKDHASRDLMLRFARPRSLSPTITWWHETDPVRFKALQDYCAQDVLAERELDRRVPELSPRERQVFEADHRINQKGIGVDHHLVAELAALMDTAHTRLTRDIVRLTNGQVRSLGQVVKLKEWLAFQGVDTPDLRRGTVQTLLADQTLSRPARIALQARLDASRSSTAKLTAIASARSHDGRLRGTFQYYGAARTGRWAGRRLQPQNLFRGSIKDVPAALRAIRAGATPEDLEMLFEDSALGVVASCLRSTIMAGPLQRLAIADFSQIEARVLAWLAGQRDALDVFHQGKDIYIETANRLGSDNRALGKVCVLALGYGMGHEKFQATALTYGVVLNEYEAITAVAAWRQLNNRIVNLWWESHKALMRVLRAGTGAVEQIGYITFSYRPGALLARLPSGRHLVYRHPKIEVNEKGYDEFTYMGSLGGGWVRLRAWPGKTCIAAGTLVLTDQGWVPIQWLSRANLIWDGISWVRHAGVVFNGTADCVCLDGVLMTPDHRVLTIEGWRHAELSAGFDRHPVTLPDRTRTPRLQTATWQYTTTTVGMASPLRLWKNFFDRTNRVRKRSEILWLSNPSNPLSSSQYTRYVEAPGICGLAFDERSLPASYSSSMGAIRWSRDSGLSRVANLFRCVLARYGAELSTGSKHRSGRQRQRVFTGKLRLENLQGAEQQSAAASQAVYDIVDAGPRHRFVVAGQTGPLIVHNCENLTQAVARDVMVEAMLKLKDLPLIATIHDELIAEVDEDDADQTLARMLAAMRLTPAWASGLPVDAAGFVVKRYQKG